MSGEEETCQMCPWFESQPSAAHPDRGYCRVNAPVAVTTPDFDEYCAVWPAIMEPTENWCGRHPKRSY